MIVAVTLNVALVEAAIAVDVNPATPMKTAAQAASLVNGFKLSSLLSGAPGAKIANLQCMSQWWRVETVWPRVACSPIRRLLNATVDFP